MKDYMPTRSMWKHFNKVLELMQKEFPSAEFEARTLGAIVDRGEYVRGRRKGRPKQKFLKSPGEVSGRWEKKEGGASFSLEVSCRLESSSRFPSYLLYSFHLLIDGEYAVRADWYEALKGKESRDYRGPFTVGDLSGSVHRFAEEVRAHVRLLSALLDNSPRMS